MTSMLRTRGLGDAVRAGADQARHAIGPCRELHHAEARMREHGEEHGVRLHEHELHGSRIARPDFFDHARDPTQEG